MKRIITIFFGLWIGVTTIQFSTAFGQGATAFFLEDFDIVTPPQLPAGWSDPGGLWMTSSSVASSGSGLNNLTVAGGQPASVFTPAVNLSGMISGTIAYLARRTSTYASDSLIVLASVDGGATFPITVLGRGVALPASDGSYAEVSAALPPELAGESSVVLLFNALGGSTSGSNIRIDDVSISGEGVAVEPENVLGFAEETGSIDLSSTTFDAAIALNFSNDAGLQGLQFGVAWDEPGVTFVDVLRGGAIASETGWQLDVESNASRVRGIVLGNEVQSLSSGDYDPLLTLRFSVNPAEATDEVVLRLEQAIGALAVRTGDDAGISVGQAIHTVQLGLSGPTFVPDATSLDLGLVAVDSTAATTVVVSNTGDSDLVISGIASGNGLFSVDPSSAAIAAGASGEFTVSFAPTFTDFGEQESAMIFSHNAGGGSDTLHVSGKGVGGRGDVSADGLVDVLDIAMHVDIVLERFVPSASQTRSGDLYPFDTPDGALDVRDLTVMAQAIVLGSWPDNLSIPAGPGAAKKPAVELAAAGFYEAVSMEVVDESDEVWLYLNREIPLRAVQVSLRTGAEPVFESLNALEGVSIFRHYDPMSGAIRLIMFRSDGGLIEPGRHALAHWTPESENAVAEPLYSTAVDAGLNRISVAFDAVRATNSEAEEELIRSFEADPPYPNPFSAERDGKVTIPVSLRRYDRLTAEVVDVLGRRIAVIENRAFQPGEHLLTWDGIDADGAGVSAGLYFLRIEADGNRAVRMVVVE